MLLRKQNPETDGLHLNKHVPGIKKKKEEDRTLEVPFPPLPFTAASPTLPHHISFTPLWSLTPSQTF